MNRLEFLEKARALAQQQCADSSCLTEEEYKAILAEGTPEVSLYKRALMILTIAGEDMDTALMEVRLNEEEA